MTTKLVIQYVDDNQLVERFVNGDVNAFEILITRHRTRILEHARRVVGNYDDAESVTQEVSLRLYRKLYQFQNSARFSSWLYSVTENAALSFIAKEAREASKRDAIAISVPVDERQANADTAEFRKMISVLAQDERQLLAMRFMQDRELADIAKITNTGLSATKMRLYRALEKIRAHDEATVAA